MHSRFAAALSAVLLIVCLPAGAATFKFSGDPPPQVAFASLPTCNAAMTGARRVVTDANTTTPGATISAGGGSPTPAPVSECNGSGAWIIPGGGGGGGGGSVSFDAVTPGTSTQALTFGTGGSLSFGSSGVLDIPSSSTCTTNNSGQICWDNNGVTGFTDPVIVGGAFGINWLPTMDDMGTAGTERVFGIDSFNDSTVFRVATTSTADAIVRTSTDAKIDNSFLGSLVSLLGQSISVDEVSATGTPSSSTYLRGDGTWSTPAGGAFTSTGGTIDATDSGGGTWNLEVGPNVLQDNDGVWHQLTSGTKLDIESGKLELANSTTCGSGLSATGEICIDTNGMTGYNGAAWVVQSGVSSFQTPSWSSFGTASTDRALILTSANGSGVYPIAATSAANSLIRTQAGGVIDNSFYGASVSLLGQTIGTGEIEADAITEPKLKAVDSPADEECLTYEAGGGGDFEWQSCGGGGASLPAQSSAPSDPSAGSFVLWLDTDDAQVKVIDSASNDYVLARRQAADPTTNALLRFKNGELSEAPGAAIDDSGVLSVSGLAVSAPGMKFAATDAVTNCSSFGATDGGLVFDDSEGIFKKCQDNSLTSLLAMPTGTSCSDQSAGAPCLDTNGNGTSYTENMLTVGIGGNVRFSPLFTAFGTAGNKRLLGLNSSNGATVYDVSASSTADAVVQQNGSGRINAALLPDDGVGDANLNITESKDFSWKSPAAGDDVYFKVSAGAKTLNGIDCIGIGGSPSSAIVRIDECNSNGGSCADTGGSVTISAVATNVADTTFTDATMADDAWVRLTLVSGTWPSYLNCRVEMTR